MGRVFFSPGFQANGVSFLHNHGTHNGRLNKAGAGGACFMLKKTGLKDRLFCLIWSVCVCVLAWSAFCALLCFVWCGLVRVCLCVVCLVVLCFLCYGLVWFLCLALVELNNSCFLQWYTP